MTSDAGDKEELKEVRFAVVETLKLQPLVENSARALSRHVLAAHPAMPEQLAQSLGGRTPAALAAREQLPFRACGRATCGVHTNQWSRVRTGVMCSAAEGERCSVQSRSRTAASSSCVQRVPGR